MSSTFYFYFLISVYVVAESFDVMLSFLSLRFLNKHSSEVPAEFSEILTSEEKAKAADYSADKLVFQIVSQVFNAALMLVILTSGFLGTFEAYISSFPFLQEYGEYAVGIFYLLAVGLLSTLVSLPFSLYSSFVLEERYGFNKLTFATWVSDLIKQLMLSVILSVPLLLALFWVIDSLGTLWWLWAAALLVAFSLVMQLLYPTVIAPLFNTFTKVSGELRKSVEDLCEKTSFSLAEVYTIDGSRRSSHSNAYFAGMGKAKRIVLYDTLVESLSTPQLLSVLAHEIGHEKKAHIKKMMLVGFIQTILTFWLLSLVYEDTQLYLAFGFEHASIHAALMLFGIFISPIFYFISPLFSSLSRKHEYEADAFAAQAMGERESMKGALAGLATKNLSNFWPHPLYSFFHYSHPTTVERIRALDALDLSGEV